MANRPKPTKVKELEGNPGKRPLNKSEPMPAERDPVCPEFLTENAKIEFERLCCELRDMGILHSADTAIIAVLAESWADWRLARDHIAYAGRWKIMTTDKGIIYPIHYPWMALEKRAVTQILKFSTELGLTPSARSRITISEKAQEDEMEKYLSNDKPKDKKKKYKH